MIARRVARIRGVVQGVGFRPFVARLAADLSLGGRVCNTAGWVELELEGPPGALARFDHRLRAELPRAARIDRLCWHEVAPTGDERFHIEPSRAGEPTLGIPPDLAVCAECLAEVFDPAARRHRYPFTNCTRCGPRFTITRSAPYDRERTSMAPFAMCRACAEEYRDPADRRFHAQPIACPECGPSLQLLGSSGAILARGPAALDAAIVAIERGAIAAIKGLGGYQLVVRADDHDAVTRLRQRKQRPAKPLALLVADLAAAHALAHIDEDEATALQHPAAPIVLVRHRGFGAMVAPPVAPGQHRLGVMLPATPLHALLALQTRIPLVCTSGNRHDEPICIDDRDALDRLASIADVFLAHDRAILRRADDSVVQVVAGRMRVLRLARGLAPVAMPMPGAATPVLALGGHLKQAAVLVADQHAMLWPQVGDLHTALARDAMADAIADLQRFLGVSPSVIATDLHPDHATTIWAEAEAVACPDEGGPRAGRTARSIVSVQHHHAHIAAVLAEKGRESALGFAWDGVGLGGDGTAWGGEVLAVDRQGAHRVAHLRPFPLPGGDAAARDGRRSLAGLCVAGAITPPEPEEPEQEGDIARFARIARSPRLAPPTTSMGRLFDAVAALTGVAMTSRFEGEAAMALEAIARPGAAPYRVVVTPGDRQAAGDGEARILEIDWRPMLGAMLAERHDPGRVASRFHATLVAMIVEIATRRAAPVVALSGGCFHNQLLLGESIRALESQGIEVLSAERVPSGDGGLALGQAWVACSRGRSCV